MHGGGWFTCNAFGRRKAQGNKRTFIARAHVRKTLLVAHRRDVIDHSRQFGAERGHAVDLPPIDRQYSAQQRPEQTGDVRIRLAARAVVERRHQRDSAQIKRNRRRRRDL